MISISESVINKISKEADRLARIARTLFLVIKGNRLDGLAVDNLPGLLMLF
jgi:hypothetical protein